MTERIFSVSGIHCESCELRIASELGRVDGLNSVEADHRRQTVTVRYDEDLVDAATVSGHLRALGYLPFESV